MCNCDMGLSEKLTLISLNNFIRKAIVPAKDQDTLSVSYNPTRKSSLHLGLRIGWSKVVEAKPD